MLGHLSWVDELLSLHLLLRHRHLMLVLHLHLLLWLLAGRVVPVHDLLLLGLNQYSFQRIHVLRVHEVVLDDVIVHRRHPTVLDEVLHCKEIIAFLLQLHQVLLLLLRPEVTFVDGHIAT